MTQLKASKDGFTDWHLRLDTEDFLEVPEGEILYQAKHRGKTRDNPHIHAYIRFPVPLSKYKVHKLLQLAGKEHSLSQPTTLTAFVEYVHHEYIDLENSTEDSPEFLPDTEGLTQGEEPEDVNFKNSLDIARAKCKGKIITGKLTVEQCIKECETVIDNHEQNPVSGQTCVRIMMDVMNKHETYLHPYSREVIVNNLWRYAGLERLMADAEVERLSARYSFLKAETDEYNLSLRILARDG